MFVPLPMPLAVTSVLGIDEGEGVDRGLPVKLVGLNVNVDEEISRLQNIILNGIEPRIYGLDMKAVELTSSNQVLV